MMQSPTINLARPINWDHPLNKGLVSMWSAVPGWNNGNIWKDLAGKNHGTLTSMTQGSTSGWSRNAAVGQYGSMLLDGTDDYVDCGLPNSLQVSLPFTISALVKRTSGSTSGIFEIGTGASKHSGIFLDIDTSGGVVELSYGDNTSGTSTGRRSFDSVSTVANGVWTHVCVVISGATTGSIYLNGISGSVTTSGNGGSIVYGANSAKIGKMTPLGGSYLLTGFLNNICIFNKALSAAEVMARFELEKKFSVGLLNYLTMTAYSYPSSGTVQKAYMHYARLRGAA